MTKSVAGILRREGKRARPIRVLDLAILLYMVRDAAEDPLVGWEDTHHTLESATRTLNQVTTIDQDLLENGLWAANLMDEIGKFKHPMGLTLDQWLAKVMEKAGGTFDKTYNTTTWDGEEEYGK